VTSALIGASKVSHIDDAVGALAQLDFRSDELQQIDALS
jgi:L-glyceraldehyde 3-phosphate reductase